MDWNAGMPGRLWRRHINPWNWWSQVFGLVLLALGLWLRNAGLLVLAALVLLASSLLDFQLPPMRGLGLGALENLAARAIRWEHAWLLRPWDRKKTLWACGATMRARTRLSELTSGYCLPGWLSEDGLKSSTTSWFVWARAGRPAIRTRVSIVVFIVASADISQLDVFTHTSG